MRYKAIFGCACLGWIVGWAVAPRIASEVWPPMIRVEQKPFTTLHGKLIPGTETTEIKSVAASAVEQFAPLVGALIGAIVEIGWQRKQTLMGRPANDL